MKAALKSAPVLVCMVLLAACTSEQALSEQDKQLLRRNDTMAADFGNATARNMAAQIIDPAPANSSKDPVYDGRVVLGAYGRYRTGTVTEPRVIGSMSVGGK